MKLDKTERAISRQQSRHEEANERLKFTYEAERFKSAKLRFVRSFITSHNSSYYSEYIDDVEEERKTNSHSRRFSPNQVEMFRRNHAAKTIQRHYRDYRHNNVREVSFKCLPVCFHRSLQARDIVGSASYAHIQRTNRLDQLGAIEHRADVHVSMNGAAHKGAEESDLSDALDVIHAATRAHALRIKRR